VIRSLETNISRVTMAGCTMLQSIPSTKVRSSDMVYGMSHEPFFIAIVLLAEFN